MQGKKKNWQKSSKKIHRLFKSGFENFFQNLAICPVISLEEENFLSNFFFQNEKILRTKFSLKIYRISLFKNFFFINIEFIFSGQPNWHKFIKRGRFVIFLCFVLVLEKNSENFFSKVIWKMDCINLEKKIPEKLLWKKLGMLR